LTAHPRHCPHRPPCPGCPRFGEPGIDAEAHASLAELARAHGLAGVPVVSGSDSAFRLRARLAIRGRLRSPKLGLFKAATHRVVTIPACSVQHPLINHAATVVRRALLDAGIAPYSDMAHQGLARYLQVVIERDSQTAQIVLVGNCAGPEPLGPALQLIRERLADRLHSLWFNANTSRGNAVLGPDFYHWQGAEAVVERFGGAAVHYPPGAFGQSNLEIAARIIEHVRELIPFGSRVAEFHAGVGAIGLSVLERVAAITLNEVSPESLRGLQMGVSKLEAGLASRITVAPGAAAAMRQIAREADVVIVDPPRKGLEPELLEGLHAWPTSRLIYVSCSLDSLRRDLAELSTGGALRLTGLTAFNLMPFTSHVETVARLDRG
jgi:23S rRNA (uracil1939-C5)-methyltransferase